MNSFVTGAAAVAALNVALNVTLKLISIEHGNLVSAVQTRRVLFAFVIGCCSILALLNLYTRGVELSSAMILMAALSLVTGSGIGILFFGNQPDLVEVSMLVTILLLLLYRWTH